MKVTALQTSVAIEGDMSGMAAKLEQIVSKQNEREDQIVCDVCLDDDDSEGDEIVICDFCLAGVH